MTLKKLEADHKSFFALWKNGDTQARPPNFKAGSHFSTLYYNQSQSQLVFMAAVQKPSEDGDGTIKLCLSEPKVNIGDILEHNYYIFLKLGYITIIIV